MDMPLLGIGTWKMGGGYERDTGRAKEEIASLRYAFSLGYRLIDTAEMYGEGASEEIVGAAIKTQVRSELYVVSKVWSEHLRFENVFRALDGSLKRIGTEYLDLYLIHRPNPSVPLFETLSAMTEALDAGHIRAIGVSNFDVSLLKQALKTNIVISTHQIEYSIVDRSAERDIIPFCKKNNIRIMAYRPLGKGDLSRAPRSLFELAEQKGATPAQIALSFITSQGITAIPKASRHEHIKENWESQKFPLSDDEIRYLKS